MCWFQNHFELIIGWVLGVLSPLLVKIYESWTQKRQFITGLSSELKDVRSDAILLVHVLSMQHASYDPAVIKWLVNNEQHLLEMKENFSILLKLIMSVPENQRETVWKECAALPGQGTSYKKINVFFMDMNLNRIPFLKNKTQIDLLRIRKQISRINEQIEEYRAHSMLTFDSSIEKNRERIKDNIKISHETIITLLKVLVEIINRIVPM